MSRIFNKYQLHTQDIAPRSFKGQNKTQSFIQKLLRLGSSGSVETEQLSSAMMGLLDLANDVVSSETEL